MNLSTLYKKLTNGKYIIGLLIAFFGFGCFSNFGFGDVISSQNCGTNAGQVCYNDSFVFLRFGNNSPSLNNGDTISFSANSVMKTSYPQYYKCYDSSDNLIYDGTSIGNGREPLLFFKVNGYCEWFGSFSNRVNFYDFSSVLACPLCPEVDTGSILSGYILETSIDTNYCVGNGYCPNECGSGEIYTGDTQRSELYINNVQKPGGPLINITIPEEIEREDYYDTGESNIDIIGYGYDQDKMQQIVNTQYYKPTAEEMSGLMEKVADFLPLIAVALLIIRIRRIIKKVF